jgi:hypothetical protein
LKTAVGTISGKTTTEVRLIARNTSTSTIRAGSTFNYKIHSTATLYNKYGAPQGSAPKTESGSYRLHKDLPPGREEVFLTKTYGPPGSTGHIPIPPMPESCEAAISGGRMQSN